MTKRIFAVLLAMAVAFALCVPAFASETVKGKIDAVDKDAKKITISGTEYSVSDEVAQTEVAVGDEVEATVDNGEVTALTKS